MLDYFFFENLFRRAARGVKVRPEKKEMRPSKVSGQNSIKEPVFLNNDCHSVVVLVT